jgi:hypothetical protein
VSNGSNSWGVSYSRIAFLEKVIRQHENVAAFTREQDIIFTINRKTDNNSLILLCADEYVFSETLVHDALHEFGPLNIIYVGGLWCGYTRAAKDLCIERKIGLYNSKELNGALWKSQFWTYYVRDNKGNIEYQYKIA